MATLSEVRDTIRLRGVVSLSGLAGVLAVSPSALEPMVAYWERQGVVERMQCASGCAARGCADCPVATRQLWYRWVGP